MPGTFVAIGLNSPRIPSGASGFMSNESRWLNPPVKNTRMTDLARGTGSGGALPDDPPARDRTANKSDNPSPTRPEKPTWMNSRRTIPAECR